MGSYFSQPQPQPFISFVSYTKDNVIKEELNIWPERIGYNTFTGRIPVGQLSPLHISVYHKLQELINACGMHNFDAIERFGDALDPYEYIKLEVDTLSGRKKMHVQLSSYPMIISTFINNVKVLCGLGKDGQELIDDIHPWTREPAQRQAGPYYRSYFDYIY